MVMGGPVTPLFQARTGLQLDWISFSQRRRKGYRETFEFDKKRVLISSTKSVQIFGYSQEDYRPYPIVAYNVDQNPAVFNRQELEEAKVNRPSANQQIEAISEENEQSPQ